MVAAAVQKQTAVNKNFRITLACHKSGAIILPTKFNKKGNVAAPLFSSHVVNYFLIAGTILVAVAPKPNTVLMMVNAQPAVTSTGKPIALYGFAISATKLALAIKSIMHATAKVAAQPNATQLAIFAIFSFLKMLKSLSKAKTDAKHTTPANTKVMIEITVVKVAKDEPPDDFNAASKKSYPLVDFDSPILMVKNGKAKKA